jgi:hypothetical protein
MKKFSLVLILTLVLGGIAYATDGGNAKSPQRKCDWTTSIVDILTGKGAHIDANGSLQTGNLIHTTAGITTTGTVNTANTACTLYRITFHSSNVGDYIKIYDGGNQTGSGNWATFKFEIPVGVAYVPYDISFPGGLVFTKEIYVETSHATGVFYGTAFYNE